MKANVTRITDLRTILKDLEGHIRNPDSLRTGRAFGNFNLLPREVLANILICAVGNATRGTDDLTVCTDPSGGDGLIYDQKEGRYMTTEHVFVPPPKQDDSRDVDDAILQAIQHKARKGPGYASGKNLVVFSEARGIWVPNKLSKKISGQHGFESVWVIHLEKSDGDDYSYCVAWLDVSVTGNAPVCRVKIQPDFKDWTVERIQL